MKKIRNILAMAMVVMMIVGLMPTNVFAEDKRKKISEVTATSDIASIVGFGKEVKAPEFTVTEGDPAYFQSDKVFWWKKNGDEWHIYEEVRFEEGTYRYETRVCIDGDAAKTHVLDKGGVTVTVGGKVWACTETTIETNSSYLWVYSPEFEVKETRQKISTIKARSDIASIVGAGKEVKKPKFTVTEGSPAYFADTTGYWYKKNGDAWDRYTDARFTEGTYKYYIKIYVEDAAGTTHVLDKGGLTATVDGKAWPCTIPDVYWNYSCSVAESVEFVVTASNPAKPTVQGSKEFVYDESEKQVRLSGFDADTMELIGDVKKTDAGDYTLYVKSKTGKWSDGSTGNLTIDWKIKKANIEGIITYTIVHRDGNTLRDILINKGFTFNGNNVEGTFSWTDESFAELPDNTIINYRQLYTWMFKPNNKNLNPKTGQARLYPYKEFVVSFNENGHGYAPREQTVKDGNKAKEPSALTDENFDFGGWYTEAECETKFDFTKPVTSDITLFAKWTKKPVTPPTPTNPDKPKAQKPKRFVYDGSEKQVTLLGFDEATMKLSGDIKKTEVGIYTLFVTPKTGTWSDGSTDDVEIEWEIMKANIEGNIAHSTVVKDGSTISDITVNTNFTFNGNNVEGTFSWINESFAELPDDTSVDYKKAYTWIFKPNNKNLIQRTGQAVLYPYKAFVVSFDANGHGTKPEDQTVKEGEQATEPTAPTDENFDFGGWFTEATCDHKYDFNTAVIKNIYLYAKWTEKSTPPPTPPTQYTLTASVDGGHGSVTPTNETVNKDETVTLTFAPDEGYELDTVTVNGDVAGVLGNVLDIIMNENKTVVVTFKPTAPTPPPTPTTYTLTARVDGGHGTVDPETKTVNENDTITLTFTPETGYELGEVTVNNVVTPVSGDSLTLTMDKDKDVVVTFKPTTPTPPPTPVTYTLTTSVSCGNGSVTPPTKTVNKDETVTLTFTPDPGYELDTVTVNGTSTTVSGNSLTLTMDGNKTVVVRYKAIGTPTPPPTPEPPTPTPDPYTPPYTPDYYDYYDYYDYCDYYRPYRPYRPHRHSDYDKKEDKEVLKEDKNDKRDIVETEVVLSIGSNNLDTKVGGIDSFIVMDVAPYIKDGRTMLPLRYIAEALGMSVDWDAKTRTVIIQDVFYRVEIPLDTMNIIVNGITYTSDVKPEIKNGRTMMPIANIARALGLVDGKDILWDAKKKQVTIIRIKAR